MSSLYTHRRATAVCDDYWVHFRNRVYKLSHRQRDRATLCISWNLINCCIKAKFYYAVQLASRSQTSSRPNSITLPSLRPARQQVCDQLASWSQNKIDQSKLPQHVEIAETCLRQVGNQVCDQVCDLDGVMEFGLNYIQQIAFEKACNKWMNVTATQHHHALFDKTYHYLVPRPTYYHFLAYVTACDL